MNTRSDQFRMGRGSLALLALLGVLGGFAPSADAQQPSLTVEYLIGSAVSDLGPKYADVEKAIEFFRNGDLRGATQYLKIASEKHPQLPPPDTTMAKMHMAVRNSPTARALLERAVKSYPNDPEAFLIFADQALRSSRLTEADVLYTKGSELANNLDNAKRKRNFLIQASAGQALIAEQREDWASARDQLKNWLEENPNDARVLLRYGRALFMLGERAEAFRQFESAYNQDNNVTHPYVFSAQLLQRVGEPEEARKAFEKAIQDDGTNADTLVAYARWLMETGDSSAAQKPLDDARRLAPNKAEIALLGGVAARMNNDTERAEKELTQAFVSAPNSQDVINQLALLLIESSDDEKRRRALSFAQLGKNLHPKNSESAVTLGWVLYQLGQLEQANAAVQSATQMGKLNSDSSYLLARMLYEQNQVDKARRLLESVLDNRGLFVHREQAEQLKEQIARAQNG